MRPRRLRSYPDLETYFRESGDTQAAFAARLRRTQSWISRVKNGQIEPTIAEALEISRLTGVPLESLSVVKTGSGSRE